MGTPSEEEPTEIKNQQAIASLVLGIVSLGLIFIIEGVGIVAGLLALYAGARGLRFAKQFDGRGQIPAIAGVSLGVIGIVVNVLPFIAAFRDATQLGDNLRADATHTALLTSEAPQIYRGDGFTLTYQADWQTLDTSHIEECQQPDVECVLRIGHPSNDGTNIAVLHTQLPSEFDADEFYARVIAQWEAIFSDAILEGPELLEINGLPAVRVIASTPGSSANEVAQILQLAFLRGLDFFIITASTPTAETFENHQAELEEIIASIRFTPSPTNTLEFPTGTFVNEQRPWAFQFNEDGTWAFIFENKKVPSDEGTYSIDDNLYTETSSKVCPFPATYTWTYDGQNLSFQLSGEDECGERRISLDGLTYIKSQ